MEDWSLVYKFSLLLTAIFHPTYRTRVYAFWFILIWFVTGQVREIFLQGNSLWFLYQTGYELSIALLTYKLLERNWQTNIVLLQCLVFISLNIHQYLGWNQGSIFYDSFLSTKDYIYWNKWGFEIILLMLWMKDEVFSAIRARWKVNNVIMVYVIGWIVYLAGNY